jgi:hypothetical protein
VSWHLSDMNAFAAPRMLSANRVGNTLIMTTEVSEPPSETLNVPYSAGLAFPAMCGIGEPLAPPVQASWRSPKFRVKVLACSRAQETFFWLQFHILLCLFLLRHSNTCTEL